MTPEEEVLMITSWCVDFLLNDSVAMCWLISSVTVKEKDSLYFWCHSLITLFHVRWWRQRKEVWCRHRVLLAEFLNNRDVRRTGFVDRWGHVCWLYFTSNDCSFMMTSLRIGLFITSIYDELSWRHDPRFFRWWPIVFDDVITVEFSSKDDDQNTQKNWFQRFSF